MAFDWLGTIGAIAPTIATAIGGPFAGVAISALGKALGLTNATEADVVSAMSSLGPEQIVEIKKAEIDFQATIASLVVQDKISAREREVKVGSAIPELLAKGAILFFLINTVGAFALIFLQIPMTDTGNYLLGACNTGSVALLKNVYDYYFGSNIDALARDNMIYNSSPIDKKNN